METFKNTSLSKTETQDMLERIRDVSSVDEILSLIKRIDALKVALDAVDTFRKQSIKYAKMEAEALLRAVDLGGLNKLRGLHKKTAEWLSEMNDVDREKYILMCEDGLTIDQIYKREVGDAQAMNKVIDRINYMRDDLIQNCKETGIVDMKPFAETVRNTFKFENRPIGEDIIDGTRNRLRRAGAVGIGDDTGIYVMPRSDTSEEVKKAILLRYESICNDFANIKKIAKASHAKLSYKDFDNGSHWNYHNNGYIIHILIALMRIGIISDEKDCYAAISKNDCRDECSAVEKQLRISKKDYIKNQYNLLFGAELCGEPLPEQI